MDDLEKFEKLIEELISQARQEGKIYGLKIAKGLLSSYAQYGDGYKNLENMTPTKIANKIMTEMDTKLEEFITNQSKKEQE